MPQCPNQIYAQMLNGAHTHKKNALWLFWVIQEVELLVCFECSVHKPMKEHFPLGFPNTEQISGHVTQIVEQNGSPT